MIIVSRLLLRFFFLRHHLLPFFLSHAPLYPSLPPFKLQIHHSSDVSAHLAPTDVRPFASRALRSRYHFRGKDRRKPVFVANRAAANEVRGGGELEKYGAGHGKNGKKESMKVSGAKRPPLFRRRLFFFLLHSPPFRNNFPFSRFRNLDGLECFTLRLQSLRISYLHVSIWFSSRHE